MKKKILSIMLAILITVGTFPAPIFASNQIAGKNIQILNLGENNIEYLENKNGNTYKYVEEIFPNEKYETKTEVSLKNKFTGEFEFDSLITSQIINGVQTIEITDKYGNKEVENKLLLMPEIEPSVFKYDNNSINPYGYGDDWVMRTVNDEITVAEHATVSVIASGLAAIVALGMPVGKSVFASMFVAAAIEIIDYRYPVCRVVGTSGFRYSRPNVYTKYDVRLIAPNGSLIRREVRETGPHYVG